MFDWIRRLTDSSPGSDDQYVVIGTVIATTFFIGFGGGVVFPILPNLGILLGISPLMVGIILSANRFSRLVVNAPAGALVDRIGTRTPFVVGMFIQGLATFGYVVAVLIPPPEFWFLSARVLWGVGSALVFATAYTIAADVSDGASRGATMGLVRGGVLFGAPTGLVVGGLISELWGTVPAFSVATVLAFVGAIIAYLMIPETHVEGSSRTSITPWDVDTSLPAVTVGLINFILFFVYFGVVFSTLVLFVGERNLGIFGLDSQGTSGIFMAVTVVTAGIFMFIGGYVSDRRASRVPTLLSFLGITTIGFVLLAQTYSLATLSIACLLIGAGQGGTSGPLMALLGDVTPDEQMGRAVGTNNVLGDIGGGIGPVVSLPMVGIVGFEPILFASAILPVVAAGILVAGIYRETGEYFPGVEMSDR